MTHFFSDIMEGKGEGGGRAVQVVKINDEDEEHSFTLGQTNKHLWKAPGSSQRASNSSARDILVDLRCSLAGAVRYSLAPRLPGFFHIKTCSYIARFLSLFIVQ